MMACIGDICRLVMSPHRTLKRFCLFLYLCTAIQLFAQDLRAPSGIWTLRGDKQLSIRVNQRISQSGEIRPFGGEVTPIYGLAISGDITLDHYTSLVRVVLITRTGEEYMVYEAYPRISGTYKFSVTDICEETFMLSGDVPASLKFEIVDGSVNLDHLTVSLLPHPTAKEAPTEEYEGVRTRQVDAKIDALKTFIDAKSMNWKAGRTSLSHLTYKEKKTYAIDGKILNWQGFEYYTDGVFEIWDKDGPPTPSPASLKKSAVLRDSWDWRNRHGANKAASPYYDGDVYGSGWMTSVKNQACNHCWCFSSVGTLEALVNLYYNQHLDLDLSEQDCAACSGGNFGNCAGGDQWIAGQYMAKTGLVDEACFPYGGTEGTCSDKCTNPTDLIKAASSEKIDNDPPDEVLKKALMEYGPLGSGIESWWHAMPLVGFYSDKGATVWIFKNSYGLGTGKNGYMEVKVSDSYLWYNNILHVPLISKKAYKVQCRDEDRDGYYNWGVGPKPAHCPYCPEQRDANDNDSSIGPFGPDWNEIPITPGGLIAVFSSQVAGDCSGKVQFQDFSSGHPASWSWDFGDSSTSALQNPIHTYTSKGRFLVTLKVFRPGSDSAARQAYITLDIPAVPTVIDGQGPAGSPVVLTASGDGTLNWYDRPTGGNLVYTGPAFATPPLTKTTTYYVELKDKATGCVSARVPVTARITTTGADLGNIHTAPFIKMVPSPAGFRVILQGLDKSGRLSVTVSNLQGEKLWEGRNQTEVDLSNQESGLYFINVKHGNTQLRQRIPWIR